MINVLFYILLIILFIYSIYKEKTDSEDFINSATPKKNDNHYKCLRKLISMAIKCYHSHGLKVSICGDRPSIDFEFFKFLIEEGIDAISLSPNCVLKTLKMCEESKNNRINNH